MAPGCFLHPLPQQEGIKHPCRYLQHRESAQLVPYTVQNNVTASSSLALNPYPAARATDASDTEPHETHFYGCCVLRLYNTVRPHSSLGYKPPAPEAWLTANQQGHGEVETATRFPLLHTPDGDGITHPIRPRATLTTPLVETRAIHYAKNIGRGQHVGQWAGAVGELVDIEEDRARNVLRDVARTRINRGVTPTGGSVASRITTPGSRRRSASQEVVTERVHRN